MRRGGGLRVTGGWAGRAAASEPRRWLVVGGTLCWGWDCVLRPPGWRCALAALAARLHATLLTLLRFLKHRKMHIQHIEGDDEILF